MKIGLFGGSFNPITKKDINLAKEAIDHLNLDKFIFIPFYKRNDRKNFKPGNDKHRMKMINLAISNEEKMELSDFEIKRKGVSYSIDTVKFFSKHPNELFFIIGGDKLTNFDKFKNVEQLSKLSNLSIFRTSKPFKKNLLKKYNGIVIENKIYENNNNKNVKNGFFNNLNDLVKIYISQNYLYLEDILKNWVDHKRLIHSRNTASLAAEYAKKNDYDSTKAFFAGLVHDICKRWPEKTNAGFLEMLGIDNSKVESYKMHQTTAALWLKNEYGIDDIEFIESIQYHTSLREVDKITLLDKIIYIADKLSVGRSFTGINKVRELALNNINEGFKEIVRITKDFIIKNNISISDEQIKIYNDIING